MTSSHNYNEISSVEIINILNHTIKYDDINKLITFFGFLSAYTEEDQFNICFNAPSSTGKTFIAMEVAKLFPPEDIIDLAGCTTRALFHEKGKYDSATNSHLIDFSHKILIFMDQPDMTLLGTLRPMLSHDKKEIYHKITDRSQGGNLKTKNIILRGYPAVVFCSASFRIDEQEGTRFIMLSPEVTTEKIVQTIQSKVSKESDKESFLNDISAKEDRNLLMSRIRAVRTENIRHIIIDNKQTVLEEFFKDAGKLVPRHQRDIGRVMCFIKVFALLNLWNRERRGMDIVASLEDIRAGLELWKHVSQSQYLGIPPYVIKFFHQVIIPLFAKKNKAQLDFGIDPDECDGLTRNEIASEHLSVLGSVLPSWKFNQDYLPLLESASLVVCKKSKSDSRVTLIHPTKFI